MVVVRGKERDNWCSYSQTQDLLAILGLLLWSTALLQGTCLVLFYQGTNYCQGNRHAWQLHLRSPSSTKATSLLVLYRSYCHLWLLTLVLFWSSYQGTGLSSGNHAMQGCSLDSRCFSHFSNWWNWGSSRSHSIHLHLKKLAKWSCLRATTLPSQHVLLSFLNAHNSKSTHPHLQSLAFLTDAQSAWLRSPFLDTEVSLLNLTECFDSLYPEICPGYRLLDNFPYHVSFYSCDCSNGRTRKL